MPTVHTAGGFSNMVTEGVDAAVAGLQDVGTELGSAWRTATQRISAAHDELGNGPLGRAAMVPLAQLARWMEPLADQLPAMVVAAGDTGRRATRDYLAAARGRRADHAVPPDTPDCHGTR